LRIGRLESACDTITIGSVEHRFHELRAESSALGFRSHRKRNQVPALVIGVIALEDAAVAYERRKCSRVR
jgi:hypothetical protein